MKYLITKSNGDQSTVSFSSEIGEELTFETSGNLGAGRRRFSATDQLGNLVWYTTLAEGQSATAELLAEEV